MSHPPVGRLSIRIWMLSALMSVGACQTVPRIVERPTVVEVKVPVLQPVDPALTQDCVPADYADVATIGAILDRLASVEECLSKLRDQLARIRQ